MGSGQAVFSGISDKAVPFLWDQGSQFVTLLEIKDQKFGLRNGIGDEKTYLVTTLLWKQKNFQVFTL